MKEDRIYGFGIDDFYTENAQQLAGKHSGVMVNNGEGCAEGKKSSGVTPGEFIYIDDKRYFVKYPTLGNDDKSYRLFNELFISFLAQKLGIDCIDCKLFIDNELEAIGVASEDFGNNMGFDQIGIHFRMGEEKFVDDLIVLLNARYNIANFEMDLAKVEHKLKVISCLDFLTKQSDRHSANLAVVIKRVGDKWIVDLSPMFDNAECLNANGSIYYMSLKHISEPTRPY